MASINKTFQQHNTMPKCGTKSSTIAGETKSPMYRESKIEIKAEPSHCAVRWPG